jgi:ABC-type transport system substrate-binding protein
MINRFDFIPPILLGIFRGAAVITLLVLAGLTSSCDLFEEPAKVVDPLGAKLIENFDTLNVGQIGNLSKMTYHSFACSPCETLIADSLVAHRIDNGILSSIPVLATDVHTDAEHRVCEVTIKEGVRFSNGEMLTADHVINSLEYMKTNEPILVSSTYSNAVFKKTGAYSVELISSSSSFDCRQLLPVGIFTQSDMQQDHYTSAHSFMRKMGSGPYLIDAVDLDYNIVRYSWNNNHWRWVNSTRKPLYDHINVHFFEKEEAAIVGLIDGSIDYYVFSSYDNFELITQANEFDITSIKTPHVALLALNENSPLFADKRVRQALSLSIDREMLTDGYNNVRGRPTDEVLHFYGPLTEPKIPPPLSPEKAGELFQKAGWELQDNVYTKDNTRFEVTLYYATSVPYSMERTARNVIKCFNQAGIYCKLVALSPEKMRSEFEAATSNPSIFLEIIRDPHDDSELIEYLTHFTGSNEHPEYEKVFMDKLGPIDESTGNHGATRIHEAKKEIQSRIREDATVIPLFYLDVTFVLRKNFPGIELMKINPYSLHFLLTASTTYKYPPPSN